MAFNNNFVSGQVNTNVNPYAPPTASQPVPIPGASQPAQQKSFQFGRTHTPMQIVRNGTKFDVNKQCTSANVVLMDPESIAHLMDLEKALAESGPGTVNSCIIRTVEGEGGIVYPVVRVKLTKDNSKYDGGDAWTTGAAPCLEDLRFGHLICGMFRSVTWRRGAEKGLSLYGNMLLGVGKSDKPIGEYVQPSVQWA